MGAYGDLFVYDPFAHPGRYQWPLSAQQMLAALLHDPNDFVASTVDTRPWVHDSHAPGRMAPPVMGEVKAERAEEYLRRWLEEATPIIVANTMRQLAAMPGMASETARYLEEEAVLVDTKAATAVRYTLGSRCSSRSATAARSCPPATASSLAHRVHRGRQGRSSIHVHADARSAWRRRCASSRGSPS